MLDGTHSVFGPEAITPALQQRCADLDIHPTGPLWGSGALRSSADAAVLEQAQADASADLAAGLAQAELRQERRALRMPVRELAWRWIDGALELAFFLPSGSYATTVLHALGDIDTASPALTD